MRSLERADCLAPTPMTVRTRRDGVVRFNLYERFVHGA